MHRLLSVLLVLLAAGAVCGYARRDTWDDDARRRKAAHLYIAAISALSNDNVNSYIQLLQRAFNLDPDDPDIRQTAGQWLAIVNRNDSAAVAKGFDMMFEGYDAKRPNLFDANSIANLSRNFRKWDANLRIAETMARQFPDRNEVLFNLGNSYTIQAMLGDTSYIDRAIEVFDRLEDRVGPSAAITDQKTHVLALRHDTAAIIRELSHFAASSPNDIYTMLSVANAYESFSVPDSAIRYFDRACALDSTNGNAILMRAQFLLSQQGDSTTFQTEAMRAVNSSDLDIEPKLEFVTNYINRNLGDSAAMPRIENMLETLVDVNSGEAGVYRLYASYLLHRGQFSQAAEQMRYVVSLEPGDRANWLTLSQLYANAGDHADAAAALADAAKALGDDDILARYEAVNLSLSGDNAAAIRRLRDFPDSTISDEESRSEFLSVLGDFCYKEGLKKEAFDAYAKSLELNPHNYLAMNNVAYSYAQSDTLLELADDYARRAVRHSPQSPTTLDTYAWVLFKKGDYAEARRQIDLTLEYLALDEAEARFDTEVDSIADGAAPAVTAPENEGSPHGGGASAEVLEHAGDIYYRCGDVVKAVDFWKQALKKEPDNASILKAKIKQRKIIENAH